MRNAGSGMTLVEVLVVAGIIVLLIGIVAPTVVRSKRAAQRLVCLINVRNVALGVMWYAQENTGLLPPTVQRADQDERPDLSANILFHRQLGFDLPEILGGYVSPGAFNCPEARGAEYEPPPPDVDIVHSNYLFAWGAVKGTPEEGYRRLKDAPPSAVAVVDLTWSIYMHGQLVFGGNHLKGNSDGSRRACFVADDQDDRVGMQYILSSLRPI